MVEEKHPIENDNRTSGLLCVDCTHCKVCMHKTNYIEFVTDVIDVRKKYDKTIFDFTIKCAEFKPNNHLIPRNM